MYPAATAAAAPARGWAASRSRTRMITRTSFTPLRYERTPGQPTAPSPPPTASSSYAARSTINVDSTIHLLATPLFRRPAAFQTIPRGYGEGWFVRLHPGVPGKVQKEVQKPCSEARAKRTGNQSRHGTLAGWKSKLGREGEGPSCTQLRRRAGSPCIDPSEPPSWVAGTTRGAPEVAMGKAFAGELAVLDDAGCAEAG